MVPHQIIPLSPLQPQINGLVDFSVQQNFFNVMKQRVEDLQDFLSVHGDRVDLDAIERRTGFTALSMASIEGSIRKVKKLLKMGAEPLKLDFHGYCCVHYAAAYEHNELLQFLVRNGIC